MPTITFKVNPDEAQRIRLGAKKQGVSVSDFLRQRALFGNRRPAPIKRVRCRFTGATIFASPEPSKPLTAETVRELLADFP